MSLQNCGLYAPDAGSGIGRSDDNSNSNDSASSDSSGSNGLNSAKISREIANENLHSAKKELRDESGLDFDWTFVSQQKMMHCALHSELKVLRRYVSSPLRKVLDEQLAMVEEHQKSLDRMIERLKEEEHRHWPATTAMRTRTTAAKVRWPVTAATTMTTRSIWRRCGLPRPTSWPRPG